MTQKIYKMILTGKEIAKQHKKDKIIIRPYHVEQLSPNSYDFRLGDKIMYYNDDILDSKIDNSTTMITIDESGLLLEPSRIYLGHTYETMGSNHFVPIIKGKSSLARLGLFIHITADLIDIGSINQWTLQLYAIRKIRIYPKMLIGQVTFWIPKGNITLYSGKYQGSKGPVSSKAFIDYK